MLLSFVSITFHVLTTILIQVQEYIIDILSHGSEADLWTVQKDF